MAKTLVATLHPTTAYASLVLTWTDVPVPSTATVNRVSADGTVSAVRNAEPAQLSAGLWAGDDYEAPLDLAFHYEATSTDSPGVTVTSATYTLASGGLSWLKHPGQPVLNIQVTPVRPPELVRPVQQGVFDVLGRARPIAITMVRNSERGSLALYTLTDNDRSALLSILTTGSTLLLQTPSAYGLGNLYVALGDVAEGRYSDLAGQAPRLWTLPFTRVDRPAGTALATVSWSNVLGNHASWSEVLSSRTSWLDLLQSG